MPQMSANKTIKNLSDQGASDLVLLQEVSVVGVDEIIEIIAESLPGINIAYNLTKAYLGKGLKLRQHRALEWVEFVRDNLDAFSEQLFENEQFQDCFVLLTEGYLKQRAEKKRELFQQILLKLTEIKQEELETFELERMIYVTNSISIKALSLLAFIREKFLEQIELDIQKNLKNYAPQEGLEYQRIEDVTRSRVIISEYISAWIQKNYNINSDLVQRKYGYEDTSDFPEDLRKQISYEEHVKSKELTGPLPELSNLGLLHHKSGSVTFGGSVGSGYSITDFGYKFLCYLENY